MKKKNKSPIRISKNLEIRYRVIHLREDSLQPPCLKLISLSHYDGRVYLFGGQTKQKEDSLIKCTNDLYVFELSTRTWRLQVQTGDIPSPRCAYSLTTHGKMLYLFGGRDTRNHLKFNDLYQFDMSINKWEKIECTGTKPSKRDTPLSFLLDNHLFVYGGHESYNYVSDLFRCDLLKRKWERVIYYSKGPPLLLGQTILFVSKEEFHFYGGLYDQEQNKNIFSNEVFKIDLKDHKFEKVDYECENYEVRFDNETEMEGPFHHARKSNAPKFNLAKKPTPRSPTFGHIAFQYDRNKVIVMGGSVHSYFQNDYKYIDDVCLFTKHQRFPQGVETNYMNSGMLIDSEKNQRKEGKSFITCRHVGQFPSRCFSSMTKVKENKWVLFGGRTKTSMEGTNELLEIELIVKSFSPFLNLLKEPIFCDTRVICFGGDNILCHSIFLLQSYYLKEEIVDLQKPFELEESVIVRKVHLLDFEKRDVLVAFEWLYGSSPHIPIQRIDKIYDIAKQLQLLEFQAYICNQLETGLVYLNPNLLPLSVRSDDLEKDYPLRVCFENHLSNASNDFFEHKDFWRMKDRVVPNALKLLFVHLQKNREHFCNYTLISKSNREFPVHKEIVISLSDYFKRMLLGNFLESEKDYIKEDISDIVMKLWIEYFYSNKVKKIKDIDEIQSMDMTEDVGVTLETVVSLFVLGDEKVMFDLKRKCQKRIIESVNKKNILHSVLITKPLLEHAEFFKEFSQRIKSVGGSLGVVDLILKEAKESCISISRSYSLQST